jgi:hypothetical protein
MGKGLRIRQINGMEIDFDDSGEVRIWKECGRCPHDIGIPIDKYDKLVRVGNFNGFVFDEGRFYHRECYGL